MKNNPFPVENAAHPTDARDDWDGVFMAANLGWDEAIERKIEDAYNS
jgi:hypothetical protein